MAYENGGGAFLIPYFFALITAGIPILIMEFSLGHKMLGSAPLTFAKVNRKWEWVGWWQVLVSVVIAVYHVAIIAWAFSYMGFSLNQAWGSEPINFFVGDYLGLTDGPFQLGGIRMPILMTLVLSWVIIFFALYGGVKKGIEFANKIFMPLLVVLLVIMLIRSVTLPGAAEGLNFLFKPDFSKIMDPKVWVAAYGQIFFTLSICFAIMLAYSSYLPKKSDINNNAFMTALANCGFSVLAGITVFGILGYMSGSAGVPLSELKLSGVFLAFATFPQAISELPFLQGLFGVLFFLSLVFAGLSSAISINEAVVSAIMDKFDVQRKPTVIIYCLAAFLVSLVFVTGAGLYILDIVDHFINSFGVALAGLVEVILLSWFFNLESVKEHANAISDFKIGSWWNICLKFITPFVLGVMMIQNFYGDLTTAYEGYPVKALITMGWVVAAAAIIIGIVLSTTKWKNETYLQVENNREVG
jgi:NSS family neurotransmitter:Na+ symporter